MIDKKYLEEAKTMLGGVMENQKVQLNNSFAQNTATLEGQKAGVNQNFDNQLEQNTINTQSNVNSYANNTLARGIGRSTVATSGQAGIKDSGARIANNVNEDRTNALGNIEAQKVQLAQALQDSLLGLTSQNDSDVMSLAMQLEQTAYNRSQDAMNRAGRGGSGESGGLGSQASSAAWDSFDSVMDSYIYSGGFSPLTWAYQQLQSGKINQETYNEMYNAAKGVSQAKTARDISAGTERRTNQRTAGTRRSGATNTTTRNTK